MSQHMTKRTMILLGLTLLASAYLLYDLSSSRKAPRSSRKASDRPAVSRSLEAKPSPKPSATPAATPRRRLAPPPPPNQPWQRDPFAMQENRLPQRPKPAIQFSGFELSGIVEGPEGYRALVNGHLVRVGDQVDGARIVRITLKGVELEKDGQTRFLPLTEKGILR
ncbi:MAG: hypothetical protein IH782_11615 [candidate division NC10 bacterium]|nr:hypothetical protein [candidate division NC10 bacterium]